MLVTFVNKHKLDHFFAWLIIYVIVVLGYFNLGYYKTNNDAWKPYVCGFAYAAAIAGTFYFARGYLLQRFFYKKKNKLFIFYFCLTALLATTICHTGLFLVLDNGSPQFRKAFFNPINILFNYIIFISFPAAIGITFKIIGDTIKTRLALEQTEKEKIATELVYLKSQINPHFLFNAINTMYFQVDESVPDAKKTMVQFSEMLRYQLYECSVDYIDIGKEITYLKNYLSLQLLRKESNVEACFEHEGVEKIKIAPLLLIPLVENAFKHLSNYDDKFNRVDIEMGFKNKMLSVTISNTFEATNNTVVPEYSGGIGLNNVRKRLSLIYPGKHNLSVLQTDNVFIVRVDLEYE